MLNKDRFDNLVNAKSAWEIEGQRINKDGLHYLMDFDEWMFEDSNVKNCDAFDRLHSAVVEFKQDVMLSSTDILSIEDLKNIMTKDFANWLLANYRVSKDETI